MSGCLFHFRKLFQEAACILFNKTVKQCGKSWRECHSEEEVSMIDKNRNIILFIFSVAAFRGHVLGVPPVPVQGHPAGPLPGCDRLHAVWEEE